MSQSIVEPGVPKGHKALAHLEKALEILDDIEVPANIGAHVDLAICQLRDALEEQARPKDPGE